MYKTAFTILFTFAALARAELITGLTTGGALVRFDSSTPGVILGTAGVTGLSAGQSLVGIDVRPSDMALVGLAYNATTNMAQVYTLNRSTGGATALSTMFALSGTAFGFDFNPVANALRIVSNATAADNNLRITTGGSGTVNADGRININGVVDPAIGLVGAAYSNNVAGGVAGRTTLYVVDGPGGKLYTQGSLDVPPGTSPNAGTLFLVGDLGLGTGLGPNVGFDISGMTGNAYLSVLGTSGTASLYSVNLNGGTSLLGNTGLSIADITVDPVPEPATMALVGCGLAVAGLMRRKHHRV